MTTTSFQVHSDVSQDEQYQRSALRLIRIVTETLTVLERPRSQQNVTDALMDLDGLYSDYCDTFIAPINPTFDEVIGFIESHSVESNVPQHLRGRTKRTIALEVYLSEFDGPNAVLSALRYIMQYDKGYMDKIVAASLPILDRLGVEQCLELAPPMSIKFEQEGTI